MSKGITGSNGLPSLTDWVDPLELAFRSGVRGYLQALLEEEVTAALGRCGLAVSPRRRSVVTVIGIER